MIFKARVSTFYGSEKVKETLLVTADSYGMAADMVAKYYENMDFESMKLSIVAQDVALWPESLDINEFEEIQSLGTKDTKKYDEWTISRLIENGLATPHKTGNIVAYVTENAANEILALDTINGTYYSGEKYKTFGTEKGRKWVYKVGDYYIFVNKRGRVIGIEDVNLDYGRYSL